MAVHDNQIREHSGMAKTINAGALKMIYDNLQKGQYRYPIKSTVRELVSNAVDSIREKLMALSILRGEASVEDFYSNIDPEDDEEGVYADSYFDPNYYSPEYLDENANRATIIYQEGGNTQKDLLRIVDNGVGLGGDRLKGYMQLGYSTKRRGIHQLGKFGIGAKVGLSTGVDFYTTISVYNGRRYKFNIYSDNIDSIIPSVNTLTGTKNEFEIWKRVLRDGTIEDYKVYYEKTEDKNGVEVQVEFKKHYKADLITAVQNQLLYFDNIDFMVQEANGNITNYPVQAKVLYRDDKILISKNNQFSKPHIVINNVAYGYVDFLELELDAKMGNIGIIVSPDEVEVIPSRESVIYRGKTRETIIKRLSEVTEIATNLVQKKLQETDFLRWIRTCISTLSQADMSGDDEDLEVINELSNIVDRSDIKPVYVPNPKIKYYATSKMMFKGMDIRLITKTEFYRNSTTYTKVKRDDLKTVQEIGIRPVFLQKGNSSNRKDLYLLSLYPDGFVTIKDYERTDEGNEELSEQLNLMFGDEDGEQLLEDDRDKYKEYITTVLNLLESSADINNYNSIVVPESFTAKEEEEIPEASAEITYASEADRRKAQGKTVAYTPGFRAQPKQTMYDTTKGEYVADDTFAPFIWTKVEPILADIDSLTDAELYYGSSIENEQGNKFEEDLLFLATAITRKHSMYSLNFTKHNDITPVDGYYPPDIVSRGYLKNTSIDRFASAWYGKPKVRLVRVSQQNVKHFQETHNHIQEFFLRINKTTIAMSAALVKWNTARYIHKYLSNLEFLTNYSSLNPDMAKKYQTLKEYYYKYFRDLGDYKGSRGFAEEDLESLNTHADKVLELQLFVRANPEKTKDIAHLAVELFKTAPGEVTDGLSTELDIYDLLHEVVEYAEPIYKLLNSVYELLKEDRVIGAELEQEIRFYVLNKRGDI